ncbi:MAG TPA: hypothetical protein VGG33_15500 [Polyangia bacterium]
MAIVTLAARRVVMCAVLTWGLLARPHEVVAAEQAIAAPGVATVALILPAEAQRRAAEELRNEVEASQFAVLSVPAPAASTPVGLRTLAESLLNHPTGERPGIIAVLAVREGSIAIYARAATGLHEIELRGSQANRPSRRRLGLSVVERLRQLREEVSQAPAVPLPKESESPAVEAPSLPPRGPARPEPLLPPPPRQLWWLGATSDLNLISARGTPTAHVSLIAERPFHNGATLGPLSLSARAAWPVLGAQLDDDEGRFIRTWTFSGEVGLRYHLRDHTAVVRPVVGLAGGVRAALTDTGEFEMRASRVVLLPALSYAASAGVRFRLRELIDLVFESDWSQAWLPFDGGRTYERTAAEAWLVRFSLGVLFEY